MKNTIVQIGTASVLAFSSVVGMVNSAGAVALVGNLSILGDLFFSKNAFDFVSSPFNGGSGAPSPNIPGDLGITTISNNIGQAGTFGEIKDLCRPSTGAPCSVVNPTPLPLDDFLTFEQNNATYGPGQASFMLTQILGPSFTPGPSQTTVQFDVVGMFFSADGMASNGTGRFTAQINNTLFLSAGFTDLASFLAAQPETAFFEASQSGVFEAVAKPIPEGSTLLGLGFVGLLGAGQMLRKKQSFKLFN